MEITRGNWFCSALVLVLLASGLLAEETPVINPPESTEELGLHTSTAATLNAAQVAQKTSVRIKATRKVGLMQETSYGSGVVIAPGGYVVTAYHVVRDADTVELITADNQRLEAKTVRVDRDYDLALLKVDCSLPHVAAPLAQSKRLGPGQEALVAGALENAVCPHMLAARIGKRRTVVWDGRRALLTSVDVDIPGGFSGCGCFDATHGHLLGVVVAKSTVCPRCGYLVPAYRITEILDLLTLREESPTEPPKEKPSASRTDG